MKRLKQSKSAAARPCLNSLVDCARLAAARVAGGSGRGGRKALRLRRLGWRVPFLHCSFGSASDF